MTREESRLQAHNEQQEIKRIVLSHYSKGAMVCVRCGFPDMRALSIDHINGNGGKHIRLVGNLYKWLIAEGFPSAFQTLCMNCQWIKRAENNENSKRETYHWHSRAFKSKQKQRDPLSFIPENGFTKIFK